ncbi:MAG: DUF5329 domain-containing protein [Desulfobulbus sp.]|nr:DUF5329 domain-containing protein [Desulfobulbus sp.]
MPNFFMVAVLTLIVSCCGSALAVDLPSTSKAEIDYLLAYLKNSGCQFNRNGKWYNADDAVSHIEAKYNYLIRKEMLSSADDFIDKAATKSSMSGKSYLVQCGNEEPTPSGEWFRTELVRYRSGKR